MCPSLLFLTNIDLRMRIKTMVASKEITFYLTIHLGCFLLMLCYFPFVIQSFLFILKIPISSFLFPAILVALLLFYVRWFHLQGIRIPLVIAWVILSVIMLALTFIVCIGTYDFSYDGMWYHQDAVRLLKEGWNPYYHFLSLEETGNSDLYVNHYPKGVWISEAVIYAFTNQLESAKMLNWLFLYASFALTITTLRKVLLLNKFWSTICAIIIAFNPVVIYQLFSFYIDGIIGNVVLCLLLLIVLWKKGFLSSTFFLIIISLTMVFLINTKYTGLIYLCIFCAGFILYEWTTDKSNAIRKGIFIGFIILLGVLLFGYPTYVKNTLEKGHPFYPVMGEGNVGEVILNVPLPADFIGQNRFKQFNLATFAKPVWSRAPNNSEPKPLFTFEGISTYYEFMRADPEMSGFGPLYAEVFCCLILGCVLLIIFNRTVFTNVTIFIIITILLSAIVIPSFWHARYVPQLWILSCFLVILLFDQKFTRWFGYILTTIMFFNLVMITHQNFTTQFKRTIALNTAFKTLKQKQKQPIIYSGWTSSFRIKLEENNIKYTPATRAYPQDSIVYFPEVKMCGAFFVKDE